VSTTSGPRLVGLPAPSVRLLPWGLGGAAILAEIGYPLTSGDVRSRLTVVTVLVFCAASLTHAWLWRGRRWALTLLVVSAGVGLLAEAVGTRTGFPFGNYTYARTLGPRLVGVPVVVPLAWTMMAYPTLVVGRRLASGPVVALVAGAALAAWDLFLDPQMVAAGHWTWTDPHPALPGVPGVPVTNFVGWLAVAVVMQGLLHALLPDRPADDRLPAVLFLWTYASSVLAAAVFFGRPGVALVGGLGMGVMALPYAWSVGRPRQRRRTAQ
jgi:uncharacterized membrane protein